jgi:hypothetical protein
MKYYLGIDDTDSLDAPYGTGKVARWFESSLPSGCRLWGVVRQQLLVHEEIPFTSHNSGACLVVETEEGFCREHLLDSAVEHLKAHSVEGSDPGLCLAAEADDGLHLLVGFGQRCTRSVLHPDEAYRIAGTIGIHLSAHGGTGQGVIGALASVGLTVWGWAGRFIEFGGLRQLPCNLPVSALKDRGVMVASIDRDAAPPGDDDRVDTLGWCRPRLMGGKPVLLVSKTGERRWDSLGRKRQKVQESGEVGRPGLGGHDVQEMSFKF